MYYAHPYTTSREKVISGAFASTMHLLFVALLVFGVNWQKKVEPQVNIVDLWSPTSAETKPVAPPPPAPKPEVKPVVQPKVEPPPPKPVAKPEVAKPDIAMKEKEKEKEKIEKERRAAEDKQKDAKKREAEAQKAQQEAQRLVKEQAEAQRAVAAQAAAARTSLLEKYQKGNSDKIKKFIVRPPNLQGTEEAEFDIVVLPDGNVLGVKLKKPSGNSAYDSAVERAINRAQPLPMPPDPALLKDFRELNLKFKAQE
jgi:colicin import membrane protein